MNRTLPARSRHAFTLVELLVVIGIIALLISILLPTLGRARAAANSVKCLSNLRSIGQSIMVYTNQNRGSYPYGFFDGTMNNSLNFGAPVNQTSDWQTLLLATILNKTPKGITYGDCFPTIGTGGQNLFACPAAQEGPKASLRVLNYACHPRVMPDLEDQDPALPPGNFLPVYKVGKLRRAAEIVLIFDAIQDLSANGGGSSQPVARNMDDNALFFNTDSSGGGANHHRHYMLDDGTITYLDQPVFAPDKDFSDGNYSNGVSIANMRWRHGKNDQANFVFADGHGEPRKLKFGKFAEIQAKNIYVNPMR